MQIEIQFVQHLIDLISILIDIYTLYIQLCYIAGFHRLGQTFIVQHDRVQGKSIQYSCSYILRWFGPFDPIHRQLCQSLN